MVSNSRRKEHSKGKLVDEMVSDRILAQVLPSHNKVATNLMQKVVKKETLKVAHEGKIIGNMLMRVRSGMSLLPRFHEERVPEVRVLLTRGEKKRLLNCCVQATVAIMNQIAGVVERMTDDHQQMSCTKRNDRVEETISMRTAVILEEAIKEILVETRMQIEVDAETRDNPMILVLMGDRMTVHLTAVRVVRTSSNNLRHQDHQVVG